MSFIRSGFQYHKRIAIPATLAGVFLVIGVSGAVFAAQKHANEVASTTQSTSSSTQNASSTSGDPMSNDTDTADEETTDEAANDTPVASPSTPIAPQVPGVSAPSVPTLLDEQGESQEPMEAGGAVVIPAAPSDPEGSSPVFVADNPTNTAGTIRFVTFNYAHGRPASGINDAVRALSDQGDIVGFQEFGPSSHRDALAAVVRNCTTCNYGLYMPDIAHGGNIPIIWKKNKFQLLSTGNLKIYDGQRVEDGAGGPDVTAKHLTWIRLKDKASGRVFYYVNNHLIPSVEADGHPRYDAVPKRVALYTKHMNTLADKVSQLKQNEVPVFIGGDFNVNYRRDSVVRASIFPYAKMNSINTWANWRYLGAPAGNDGTMSDGSRVIDYVFATRNNKVTPVSNRILSTYGSDHHAVQFTIKLK